MWTSLVAVNRYIKLAGDHVAAWAALGAVLSVPGALLVRELRVFKGYGWGWPEAILGGLLIAAVIIVAIGFTVSAWRSIALANPGGKYAESSNDPNRRDRLEVIAGRHFQNTDVVLDGKNYVGCTFLGVTFIYDGGPVSLLKNTIGSHNIRSNVQEINHFAKILIMLGHVSSNVLNDTEVMTSEEYRSSSGNISVSGPIGGNK